MPLDGDQQTFIGDFVQLPEPNIIKLLMAVTIYNKFCPLQAFSA
jgi:hypothetical protein